MVTCKDCLIYRSCENSADSFEFADIDSIRKWCDCFRFKLDYVTRAAYNDALMKESVATAKLYELKRQLCQNPEDVVAVVRCKDCKYGRAIDNTKCPEKYFKDDCVVCGHEDVVGEEPMIYVPMHYCSCGERKENK